MHFIVATSRGKGLQTLHDTPNVVLKTVPGGTYQGVTEAALELLSTWRIDLHLGPHFVYVVAGLPDLTTKLKRRNFGGKRRYEEVVFLGDSMDVAEMTKRKIDRASADITNAGGGCPSFATIASSSIKAWNRARLDQQKTTHLEHFKHYDDMQISLHQAAIYTNRYIHQINNLNGVRTPRLGETVLKSRRGTYRPRYGRMGSDGVHLDTKTCEMWNKIMGRIIYDY